MKRAALLALALASAAACGRAPAPSAFDAAIRSEACAGKTKAEWVSTWPVPLEKGGYAVLFYALDRSASTSDGLPRVRPTKPLASAVLAEGWTVTECRATGGAPAPLDAERYPPAAMALEEEPFDAASAKMLALTKEAGKAFVSGAKDPALAKAYWAQFQLMGEPALRPFYYAASPAFWEWLRRENGASLQAVK